MLALLILQQNQSEEKRPFTPILVFLGFSFVSSIVLVVRELGLVKGFTLFTQTRKLGLGLPKTKTM